MMAKLKDIPNLVQGWACPNCKKIYNYNEQGKNFANSCCKCSKCKINYTKYNGLNIKCEKCNLIENIEDYEQSILRMQKNLDNMKKDLEKINRGK